MLTSLEQAKERGAKIVSVNLLRRPETSTLKTPSFQKSNAKSMTSGVASHGFGMGQDDLADGSMPPHDA
jgi:hypothetical protein